jgi:cyclopropane-fatty-acyl-phospholipid synthase
MFWEKSLAQWIEQVRAEANVPVRLALWTGQQYDFGKFTTPQVTLQVKDPTALPYLLKPSLSNLAEAYVKGKIDVEGKLSDIIGYAYAMVDNTESEARRGILSRLRKSMAHTRTGDRRSVEYHYDVSNAFYELWLDENMVYTCAYFENGNEDLATAQIKKIDHVLTKIRAQPGQHLLDIGCGWGALVLRAAEKFGMRCVGVTLAREQFDLAKARVKAAGLEDRIEIRLEDYRDVQGQFDRVASIGMYEQVGRKNLPGYFSKIAALLTDDGIAINHGITLSDDNYNHSPGSGFLSNYVFPDGELPHLSLAIQSMQHGGLETLDVESLRHHYVRTLDSWVDNFEARAAEARALIGDEKFRIWRVYLAGCAHAFRIDNMALYQIVCCKAKRMEPLLPWSRRYMYE